MFNVTFFVVFGRLGLFFVFNDQGVGGLDLLGLIVLIDGRDDLGAQLRLLVLELLGRLLVDLGLLVELLVLDPLLEVGMEVTLNARQELEGQLLALVGLVVFLDPQLGMGIRVHVSMLSDCVSIDPVVHAPLEVLVWITKPIVGGKTGVIMEAYEPLRDADGHVRILQPRWANVHILTVKC
jgi:hypothetical protein